MIDNKVSNIVNGIINSDINNIIYNQHNSIFDLIIKSLDYRFIESPQDNTASWYNLWISNDPIFFSQNYLNQASLMHINSLLFFHNAPPSQFKKEDGLILKRHILNSHKVLCSSNLANSWLPSDNKWHNIEYGIPFLPYEQSDKRENIVFFNFNNNENITGLYNNIKTKIENVTILNSLPKSLEKLYDILHNAQICIDFENTINSLFAASCGCFCFTTYDNDYLYYYKKITSINDLPNDILSLQENKINMEHIIDQQKQLIDKFSFDMFVQRVSLIINSIMKDKYVL